MVGTSGVAASADLTVVSRTPIAPAGPSWRSATLFVLRGDGEPDSDDAASGAAPSAQAERLVSAPPSQSAMRSSRASTLASHGLFAPVSGSSER